VGGEGVARVARIVGIVNVTPDSFSDGGLCLDPPAAVAHGLSLLADGADELDVGGQATSPGAPRIAPASELARVVPVIKGLREAGVSAPISIDTYEPAVARAAIAAGADGINDITGFRSPEMRALVAETGVRCVVMAGAPEGRPDPGARQALAETWGFLEAQAAALAPAPCALDPGFGFSGTRDDDIKLYGELLTTGLAQVGGEGVARVREWDHGACPPGSATHFLTSRLHPLYIGLSRKRFLRTLFGDVDLDQASSELSCALAAAGARYLRVHEVALARAELERFVTGPSQLAYVALGSNIGPCEEHLRAALRFLDALPATTLDAIARTYVSEPAADHDQPPFLNTVARLRTRLGPRALFAALQACERLMGRVKTRVNGPRSIDLDLLSAGEVTISTPALQIPHPRAAERAFVVEPLRDLDPDYRFPTGQRSRCEGRLDGAIMEVRPALKLELEPEPEPETADQRSPHV